MQLIYTAQTVEGHKVMYGKPNVAIFNSLNYICSFVFVFNMRLNIQRVIEYSTSHSIIYSTTSTIYSTFNFNFTLGIRLFSRTAGIFGVGRRPTHLRPLAEATSGDAARKNLWPGAVLFTVPIDVWAFYRITFIRQSDWKSPTLIMWTGTWKIVQRITLSSPSHSRTIRKSLISRGVQRFLSKIIG